MIQKLAEKTLELTLVAGGVLSMDALFDGGISEWASTYGEIGLVGIGSIAAIYFTARYISQAGNQAKRDDEFRERQAQRADAQARAQIKTQYKVAQSLDLIRQEVHSQGEQIKHDRDVTMRVLSKWHKTLNANTRVLAGVVEESKDLKRRVRAIEEKLDR